jgi:predicted alpha/beta hydrolase family esterase
MNAFIIHGAYGDENENWFPWLKRELESQRYTVITPRFPTPEGQSLEAWLRIMHEYQNKIDEKTIMIGHSIGCAFILNVLERSTHPVKAV